MSAVTTDYQDQYAIFRDHQSHHQPPPLGFYGTYPRPPPPLLHAVTNDMNGYAAGPNRQQQYHNYHNGKLPSSRLAIEAKKTTIDEPPPEAPAASCYERMIDVCSHLVDIYIRPCVAEFLSVLLCVFIACTIEAALVDRHVPSLARPLIVCGIDALCVLIFVSTFRSVHINPAITICQLFTAFTCWPICALLLLMQVLGAMAGVFLFEATQTHTGAPSIGSGTDSIHDAYRLVLHQTIGTLIVALCHVMISRKRGRRYHAIAHVTGGNAIVLAGAVMIASILSGLESTATWNPIRCLASALAATSVHGAGAWTNQHIYWLGPSIGALFASFLYRLLFANRDKRVPLLANNCDCEANQ